MHIAIGKCDSLEDAQDLVQNTLLEGLLAIQKGIEIENAKSWLITVLNRKYYIRGEGIKKIAVALSLPKNTVKSRLRLGRDKLRKDFTMEKYEKQSFEPESLWISCSGNPGMPIRIVCCFLCGYNTPWGKLMEDLIRG